MNTPATAPTPTPLYTEAAYRYLTPEAAERYAAGDMSATDEVGHEAIAEIAARMEDDFRAEGFITWNSGAGYTEHGQRIAAAPFMGGAYMVDIDRGLDYWYPVPCTRADVWDAYLYNRHASPAGVDYSARRALHTRLEIYAASFAPILKA